MSNFRSLSILAVAQVFILPILADTVQPASMDDAVYRLRTFARQINRCADRVVYAISYSERLSVRNDTCLISVDPRDIGAVEGTAVRKTNGLSEPKSQRAAYRSDEMNTRVARIYLHPKDTGEERFTIYIEFESDSGFLLPQKRDVPASVDVNQFLRMGTGRLPVLLQVEQSQTKGKSGAPFHTFRHSGRTQGKASGAAPPESDSFSEEVEQRGLLDTDDWGKGLRGVDDDGDEFSLTSNVVSERENVGRLDVDTSQTGELSDTNSFLDTLAKWEEMGADWW